MSVTEQEKSLDMPLSKYILIIVVLFVGVVALILFKGESEVSNEVSKPVVEEIKPIEQSPEQIADVLDNQSDEPETTDFKQAPQIEQVVIPETKTLDVLPPVVEPIRDQDWLNRKIKEVIVKPTLQKYFVFDNFVSNFVVFVDNAVNGEITRMFSPFNEPLAAFKAKAIGHDNNEAVYLIDPNSYSRFDPYVEILNGFSASSLVDLYSSMSDVIDDAYHELGYESGHFNDKLIDTIELLLSTPVINGDIKLIAPSAMFEFADPELEELLPIQKLLIRMGPENQRNVQSKLREVKRILLAK